MIINCKFRKVAQIRIVPRKSETKKRSQDYGPQQQIANTATHIRKRDLTENPYKRLKPSHRNKQEQSPEKVMHQHPRRECDGYASSSQRIQDDFNYESISKIASCDHSPQKQKRSEKLSQLSSASKSSYRSTTHQQIMSKYDIKQIMKRKHKKQDEKWRNFKLVGKILLIILLFPFSLIYLLISHIQKKNAQKQKQEAGNEEQQEIQRPRKKEVRRIRKQKDCCTKCCDKIQICCQNCFCYYLCCECCEDCNCCTIFCRKVQKCAQCLCDNQCTQGMQECFSRCFVKNCQKCCRYICCINRTHEKLDTIERLERMSQKSQDRLSVY